MLTSIDRVLLVVRDREAAVRTWRELFDAEVVGERESACLGARVSTLHAGVSEVDLLEPGASGPVAAFAERWDEGLYGVGLAAADVDAGARRLDSQRVGFTREGDFLCLDSGATPGVPVLVCPYRQRPSVGLLRGIYEVTNVVDDWQDASALYTRIFDLDPLRYHHIVSTQYGYEGVLTLFDPPDRLDRIEVAQPNADGAMRRFYQRRGQSLYMCFAETDAPGAVVERLRARGARFAGGEGEEGEGASLFVHPTALHGMLMGVSRTDQAWAWSGRPALARRS
jgi:catechol 2,3-dioxygenase-like lactoylglutathione lyase family enzyme